MTSFKEVGLRTQEPTSFLACHIFVLRVAGAESERTTAVQDREKIEQ